MARRKWFQFTIAQLIALSLAVCVVVVWWVQQRELLRQEAEIARLLPEVARLEEESRDRAELAAELASLQREWTRLKTFTRDEAVNYFLHNATVDETMEFNDLLESADPLAQERLQELVLFKLNDDQLFALGITATDSLGNIEWGVAWSSDAPADRQTVATALEREGITATGGMGHGLAAWYVNREDFFRARRALLEDPAVQELEIEIATPNLHVE